ncbi:hypothetical protein MPPM_1085 [Methylorubrum populi]|uniref:Uncharacterized protein n=2 Tax=Methylorubrum TaxID=2282523 RepID=A0A160PEF9_9HYPH|nr:hypothetical protein MPPM_1085 [Methylorubrum populi]
MLQCISPTKIGVRPQSGNEAENGAGLGHPRPPSPASATSSAPAFLGDPMTRAGGTVRLPRRSLFRSGAGLRLAAALILSSLLWAVILWAKS